TNYYADALLAARHVMTNNAILSNAGRGDSTWQDQFVRGLANFAQDNQLWGLYHAWLAANAAAAWNVRRTDRNLIWNAWTSPTATNDCYSLECLSAAVIQQVLPRVTSLAPVFALQPSNQITAAGNTVQLHAAATNGQPITYQWFHEDHPIPGATNTNLILLNATTNYAGSYWVMASNSLAGSASDTADVFLIGNTNGFFAQDSASNYDPLIGFTGNQGFGFGPWILSTVGGGAYISGDAAPLFGLWNNTASAQTTAARFFDVPLPLGVSLTLQLQMNTLESGSQNGFELVDAAGSSLFRYWHQGGDNANGHYADAAGPGTAPGFAYDYGQLDSFQFTLNSATNYTFTDITTGKNFNGRLSGTAICGIILFRINSAGTPASGQDFKFNNLAITTPPVVPGPTPLLVESTVTGWSFHFAVAPGYRYRLQRALSLSGPWTDIGTLTGPQTGVADFVDPNPPTTNSFYRTVTP
ncbi:MAG TPA: immunoglobulin domain-containing protein, partial [Dongiaceae bacterium]|nr:immunoglobulin domain-containing protein [Dongiaceae bacterium]